MQISTLLMFAGQAEEAMHFHFSLFPNSEVVSIERYGQGEAGAEGSVKRAVFELCGVRYMCIDSSARHQFTFTPAISVFVSCDTEEQFEHAYEALSMNGEILMPPARYDFSSRFAWTQDKYGVSWQLSLS